MADLRPKVINTAGKDAPNDENFQSARVLLMYQPEEGHLARLEAAAPGARIEIARSEQEALALAPKVRVILGNRFFLQSLEAARSLIWMQSNSMGMDLILSSALVQEREFILTSASGVYDDEVADHALALVLALCRGIADAVRDAGQGRWLRRPLRSLSGLEALVFGYGGIGRAITRRLLGFGTHVNVVRRQAHRSDAEVESLDLEEGLARLELADLVFLALPLTSLTDRLFDRRQLRRLKPGAFLVNVSRGRLIVEEDLAAELDRLGGVGLDCFATEPLPPEHWLWSHPRVICTPHVSRSIEPGLPRWTSLFEDNLRRFFRGEPLENVVDKRRGY